MTEVPPHLIASGRSVRRQVRVWVMAMCGCGGMAGEVLGEDDKRGRRREVPAVIHIRGAAALNGLLIWRFGVVSG